VKSPETQQSPKKITDSEVFRWVLNFFDS
jgi:hypothetical protein